MLFADVDRAGEKWHFSPYSIPRPDCSLRGSFANPTHRDGPIVPRQYVPFCLLIPPFDFIGADATPGQFGFKKFDRIGVVIPAKRRHAVQKDFGSRLAGKFPDPFQFGFVQIPLF